MRTIKCQSSELLNFKKKGTAKWTPFSGLEIPTVKRATDNISVLCNIHSLGKLHLAVTSDNLEMVSKAIKQERENCLDIFQPISQNIIEVQLSPQTPKKPGTPPPPQKKKISHSDFFGILIMAAMTLQEKLKVSWAWGKGRKLKVWTRTWIYQISVKR